MPESTDIPNELEAVKEELETPESVPSPRSLEDDVEARASELTAAHPVSPGLGAPAEEKLEAPTVDHGISLSVRNLIWKIDCFTRDISHARSLKKHDAMNPAERRAFYFAMYRFYDAVGLQPMVVEPPPAPQPVPTDPE